MSVTSDSSLNAAISTLYPPHNPDSVAVIFYTFQDERLTSTLFAPGQPFEQVAAAVTANHLHQLQLNVVQGLRLGQLVASRSPRLRGAVPVAEAGRRGVTLDAALAEATRVLLPFKTPLARFRHLIFIPAYNIGTFPLGLLRPFGTGQLLIEKCSYSLALGLDDFLKSRQEFLARFRPTQLESLVRGGALNSTDSWQRLALQWTLEYPLLVANPQYPTGTSYYFPNLPGAEREAAAVLPYAHKGYKILRGSAATKDSLFRYLGRADLLYIASHGLASPSNPMDGSYLVLGGADPYLTARQIQHLPERREPLPELVVLSACQTGLGKPEAVGTVGLARAFLLAGATDVVISLWNVDDEATAYLMGRFMHHLVSEPYAYGPAEPLRKAMLDCRLRYPNPLHWASFTVAGMAY